MKRSIVASAVASTMLLLAGAAPRAAIIADALGPPLICHPIQIGDARTLPEGQSDAAAPPRLVRDTLDLLAPGTPVLVRMETMRRALLLSREHPSVVWELYASLQARVLDGEARGSHDAAAWFDAAYMIASWSQLDPERAPEVALSDGCVGYSWLKRAIALAPNNPGMQFAAALVTHPAMHKGTAEIYRRHLARAAAGSATDQLLEKNVRAHCENWQESFDDLKREGGASRDGDARR